MALPLTLKTETDLVLQLQCLPSIRIDQETGRLQKGADLHIQIDSLEARREDETMTTMTVPETHEDSRFITKMPLTINVAHGFLTKI
jgi:hypothetical protein